MPLINTNLSSTLSMLALVIGLVFLSARLFRTVVRWRTGSAVACPRTLVLQETLQLDRSRRLLVIGYEGRDLLLLTGGTADLVVGWLPGAGGTAKGREA